MATSSNADLDLLYQPAHVSARMIRDKAISSLELTRLYLHRISAINPVINAVVALAETAETQARNADVALAKGPVGPLHGVPMTIKDCFDTAAVTSTWGTLGRKSFVPDRDATIVARLKAAGAILLGKTNTPEFTLNFETHNAIHGFTHNPYNTAHSPGGSSGGAAALIAAAGTPYDIGTDYGGSIRLPAHCCGVTGIKPTSGSVPRTGMCLPPGVLTDHLSHVGPLARSVADLVLLLEIIWGPDDIDSRVAAVPFRRPETVNIAGLRCALMLDNGIVTPDVQTQTLVSGAAQLLRDGGASMRDAVIPTAQASERMMTKAWSVGAYQAVAGLLKQANTDPKDSSINWFRSMGESASLTIDAAELADYLTHTEAVRRESLAFMHDYDLLICPVSPGPAQIHPAAGEGPFPGGWGSYTSLFDLTGFPAGVVRAGTSESGLPIGVQLVGRPWRDDVVLAAMGYLQNAFGEFDRPDL
ncbi:MAG: amidase [Proteobacteria bacterium]|nr:amidase [Pseudomonadota bacterium]